MEFIKTMAFIKPMLFGVILPAAVGGGLFALVGYWAVEVPREPWEILPFSLSMGYIAGNLGLEGLPTLRPDDRIEFLIFITSFSLLTRRVWEEGDRVRSATQLVVSFALPCLILAELFREEWRIGEGFAWLVGMGVATLILWKGIELSFTLLPRGNSIPVVYIGICGASTFIFALSGSTRFAQHCGVLVAIFGAIWFVSRLMQYWWEKEPERAAENPTRMRLQFPTIAAAPLATLLSAFWMNGCFYEGVPPSSIILLAVAPLFALIGQLKVIQQLSERTVGQIQVAFIAVPVIVAVYISI